MIPLVAYLILFVAVGIGFILVNLLVGKIVRPHLPGAEKKTIYECGEPTIGSAWIQFDLRFYVVALLFVIFDVEVAFFFPWAEVFGKANTIKNTPVSSLQGTQDRRATQNRLRYIAELDSLVPAHARELEHRHLNRLTKQWDHLEAQRATATGTERERLEREMARVDEDMAKVIADNAKSKEDWGYAASQLAWLALVEIAVFFGVLLVGFAYLWRRGDLAWVRSTAAEQPTGAAARPTTGGARELVGAGS